MFGLWSRRTWLRCRHLITRMFLLGLVTLLLLMGRLKLVRMLGVLLLFTLLWRIVVLIRMLIIILILLCLSLYSRSSLRLGRVLCLILLCWRVGLGRSFLFFLVMRFSRLLAVRLRLVWCRGRCRVRGVFVLWRSTRMVVPLLLLEVMVMGLERVSGELECRLSRGRWSCRLLFIILLVFSRGSELCCVVLIKNCCAYSSRIWWPPGTPHRNRSLS